MSIPTFPDPVLNARQKAMSIPTFPDPVLTPDGKAPTMLDVETGLDFLNKDHLPVLERHLLGCVFSSSLAFDEASEIVEAGDFAIAEHAELFRACYELRSAGREVTSADLFEYLVRTHKTDFALFRGNAAYWIFETCELEPIGTRARYYAIHIREAATFRRLRGVAAEVLSGAMKPWGPAADVIGHAESMLFDLSHSAGPKNDNLATAGQMMTDALERIDQRAANGGRMLGLPTGYADLDKLLAGMREGQMVIVGARPSVGKTAFALNIAHNVAGTGAGVLFFSLEMPKVEISDRLLATGSGVAMHRINSGVNLSGEEIGRLTVAASRNGIGGCDLFLDDNPNQSGESMMQITRRAVRKFGVQLVIVDYLQLMRPDNPKENRNAQVGALARKVKLIARECNVPVLCLAQLNREVEGQKREPILSDLRDSGEIEQHADDVLFLHVPANEPMPPRVIDVIVAKNRNGPKGKVLLTFLGSLMRFHNHCGGDEPVHVPWAGGGKA